MATTEYYGPAERMPYGQALQVREAFASVVERFDRGAAGADSAMDGICYPFSVAGSEALMTYHDQMREFMV